MKRLVVDLDDTISFTRNSDYANAIPDHDLIDSLKNYKTEGFDIIINTSRNVRTYEGNVGKINANTLPIIIDWLNNYQVPYDEIYTGKPWCGTEGFYVDDKAIRPSEFKSMSYENIRNLLKREQEQ